LEKSTQKQGESEHETCAQEESGDKVERHSTAGTLTSDQVDGLILAYAKEKKASEECVNRLKYLQADFDNYAKRMDRQMDEAKRRTAESIYSNMLEVLDELELALRNGSSNNNTKTLIEGVEMTMKKLKKLLTSEGISEIACAGKTFDPKFHSAVSTVECADVDEGVVVEELRKGYAIGGRVIRPAMVKVSVKKSQNDDKKME
jgi:molecular chaperone GrpE